MAQLIKLKDYISRYEWNPYRYPSQYIRLKQENWNRLYEQWVEMDEMSDPPVQEESSSTFSKLKTIFKGNESVERDNDVVTEPLLPSTENELRHYFLNKLFPFQLKWATSTVTDVSFIDSEYETDETLQYFLQRFPDIYLIMYYPIFSIKEAPVDGEIIIISPIGIEIIYLLEKDPNITIMAGDERVWIFEQGNKQSKELSPVIALKRTEQIINSIFKAENISFTIEKTVLSRTNNIVFNSEPYRTNIVGKQQYEEWFQNKRRLSSSLKSDQLKVIEKLLKYCLTNSVRRPEWEEDDYEFIIDNGD